MEKSQNHMTERMLNLTLEIIYLLTGENYIAFKLSDGLVASNMMKIKSPITEPQSHSLRKNKKVQEVTSEIIELLTGEVPIRYQDTTGCFSMEEWEYLEGHKDLYKNFTMENHMPLASQGRSQNTWRNQKQTWGERANFMQELSMMGLQTSSLQDVSRNRNPPERCPRPLYSRDSLQQDQEIPHLYQVSQDTRQVNCRAEARAEADLYVRNDDSCKEVQIPPEMSTGLGDTGEIHIDDNAEEEVICVKIEDDVIPIDINTDAHVTAYNQEKHLFIIPEGEIVDDAITKETLDKNPIPPNLHPAILSAGLLSQEGSISNHVAPMAHQADHRASAVFQCSLCGKCFAWKSSLVEHQRTHTGEKPYSCSECGKCFSKKTKLTLHQRTHTGERPFACSECGKRFTRRDHLTIHQRTHTGVKPYSCSECRKSFSQRAFLIVHQRAHSGVKPYSCSECGKGFTGKAHLIVHQRTHTGEKPHMCAQCGKCFSERSQLLRHRASHSESHLYLCPVCGSSFNNKSSLVRHQQLHASSNSNIFSQ